MTKFNTFFKITRRVIPALIVLQMSGAASAQDEEETLCNVFLPDEFLAGEYMMKIGPGTYTVNNMILPYGKVHELPATIYQSDGTLVLVSEKGMEIDFIDVESDERDWKFEKGGDFDMAVNSSDLALLEGCGNVNELPRFMGKGNGSYFANDGVEVPTSMKLFVHNVRDEVGVDAVGGMISNAPHGVVFKLRLSLRATE